MGSIGPAKLSVNLSSRESEARPYFSDTDFELWLNGKGGFRMTSSSMWGDASRLISDGKTLLKDPFDYATPVTLWTIEKQVFDCTEELKPSSGFGIPILYLVHGPKVLDTVAPKESAVVATKGEPATLIIEKSPWGRMELFYKEEGKSLLVEKIAYDNWAKKQKDHELYPEWVEAPQKGTLDVLTVRYGRRPRFERNAFSTQPPAGLKVDDKRKKPAKPSA